MQPLLRALNDVHNNQTLSTLKRQSLAYILPIVASIEMKFLFASLKPRRGHPRDPV